jgi:hypothetical protein
MQYPGELAQQLRLQMNVQHSPSVGSLVTEAPRLLVFGESVIGVNWNRGAKARFGGRCWICFWQLAV